MRSDGENICHLSAKLRAHKTMNVCYQTPIFKILENKSKSYCENVIVCTSISKTSVAGRFNGPGTSPSAESQSAD